MVQVNPEGSFDIELIQCVIEQFGYDLAQKNFSVLIQRLAMLSDEALLELLPNDHGVYEGTGASSGPGTVFSLPSYVMDATSHDIFYGSDGWTRN